MMNRLLFFAMLGFYGLGANAQQEGLDRNYLGLSLGAYGLIDDYSKDEFDNYWGITVDYERGIKNSDHWSLLASVGYKKLTGKNESGNGFTPSFNIVDVSPGIRFNLNSYIGLTFNINVMLIRDYQCEVNGVPCYKVRSYPMVEFPEILQPVIAIPLSLPMYKNFKLSVVPSYSTASFYEVDNSYRYFGLTLKMGYEF